MKTKFKSFSTSTFLFSLHILRTDLTAICVELNKKKRIVDIIITKTDESTL